MKLAFDFLDVETERALDYRSLSRLKSKFVDRLELVVDAKHSPRWLDVSFALDGDSLNASLVVEDPLGAAPFTAVVAHLICLVPNVYLRRLFGVYKLRFFSIGSLRCLNFWIFDQTTSPSIHSRGPMTKYPRIIRVMVSIIWFTASSSLLRSRIQIASVQPGIRIVVPGVP